MRTREVHIDTLPQRESPLLRRLPGNVLKPGRVKSGAVRKAGAELRQVLAPERGISEELQLIGNEHNVPCIPAGVDATGGVGDDERLNPQKPEYPDGIADLLHGVALVVVHPPLHDRDPAALQRAEHQSAFVTEGGGTPEMGDLAIGHIDRSFHLLAQLTQPGAENEQYLGGEAADALFQRLCAGLIVRKAVLHAENASCAVMWNQKTVYYIPANGKKQSSWENILHTDRAYFAFSTG